jgi:hypothetical protein
VRAQEYIKELELKAHKTEGQVAHFKTKAESLDFDRKYEKELEHMRKKYDDKCSEMMVLVKRLNVLAAFKNKTQSSHPLKETRTSESRDVSPVPSTSVLKRKMKSSYKALCTQDIHMAAPAFPRRVIERSKSTERIQTRPSRASSRLRGNMSGTVKK